MALSSLQCSETSAHFAVAFPTGAAGELVSRVHDYDVRIGVQLNHFGRQLDFPLQSYQMVTPSPIPWSKHGEVPREISVDEIEELIERHVEAATRITEAGFDFVELKACHGYLLSSFISPHSNRRNDQYGGDLAGRVQVGKYVLIIGGNGLGLEAADFLAAQGRKVEVVEQLERVGSDLGPTVRWHLRHRLAELRVSLLTSTRAAGISDEGVVLVGSKGKSTYRAVQGVVLAAGSVSRRELVAEVEGMASEVYVIGDAVRPRNAYFAIREGAEAGRRI